MKNNKPKITMPELARRFEKNFTKDKAIIIFLLVVIYLIYPR